MISRRPAHVLILGLNLSLSGCGSDGAGTDRTPRIHSAGGAPGASSGGANAAPSGGSGGMRNTGFGGAIGIGGAFGSSGKGNGGSGGSPSGGGSGGSIASGGSTASGGTTASGGSPASGGNTNLPGACAALFCEDFESGMLASPRWTTDTDGGTVNVTTDPLAHGNYAAHFHLNANGRQAVITMDAPTELGRHVYGRSVFHVTSPTDKPVSASHTVYFTAGDGLNEKHYELGGYDASWQTSYWYPGGENIAAGGKVPVNQSVCLEWEFDDAPSGVVRVWIDGVQNDEFTDAGGGNKLTAFTKLSLGIKFFQPEPNAVDLTLDDVAFDTQRVGCSF